MRKNKLKKNPLPLALIPFRVPLYPLIFPAVEDRQDINQVCKSAPASTAVHGELSRLTLTDDASDFVSVD